jgi:hypothetical protein
MLGSLEPQQAKESEAINSTQIFGPELTSVCN